MPNHVWLDAADVARNADAQRAGALQAAEKVRCHHSTGKQNDKGQNNTIIILPSFRPQ
jgi:hypothetical protein